ncbi:DUF1292 domain-containing protein [Oribacterium sp. WCC10]|uniref:DUF1292 domain-containing protein n=1 Tax=Oribacterium sp. WCC10 TaxID=1855343 RepID=UPI0008EFD492|nr:DUF1292 domain-containing protein [Oribacterium sp. WCC10]SFG66940.1 Protein of unknown function [Oribacterium sp. WCC10]
MEFRGKKIEDLIITLPFMDGTTADYGVHKYFKFEGKEYFAMLPLIGKKELDHTKNISLYEVQEDADKNPVVVYIEDDAEFEKVANYYSNTLK